MCFGKWTPFSQSGRHLQSTLGQQLWGGLKGALRDISQVSFHDLGLAPRGTLLQPWGFASLDFLELGQLENWLEKLLSSLSEAARKIMQNGGHEII